MNDEFVAMTKKKKDNIELGSQKLDRAEKLIHGEGGFFKCLKSLL